jgi:hypothetical protein
MAFNGSASALMACGVAQSVDDCALRNSFDNASNIEE